jgi:hypothetical protein
MSHEMRLDAAVSKIDQVESPGARVKGEVCDANEVAVRDAIAMLVQGVEGSLE